MKGIELRDARARYGPLEALHGITLAAPAATLTVLLGRNGSGRTTALRALAGTIPLSSGAVLRDGRDITRHAAHERAARGLCFVPDRQAVFSSLTVAENLELCDAEGDFGHALTVYPELRPLLPRRAGTLSGGEQRMLALSRALLTRAPHSPAPHSPAAVILVDEPTQGMSPTVAARTYTHLTDLAADQGACVVVAEQQLPPALRERASRTAVVVHELRRGTVALSGEAAEFNPAPTPPSRRVPE
ncbi:ATP-binding cassette domain-containing protein [Streptomyces alboniger]|uniref:ATP-binding cassette domain-containing protein n=1 Tax=Streptomyces alboniger TaxID=132473 RepID=A0A5J6HFZ2_STRAD|nr:ATP-binding cassette domain-containing protein [Streptomyces alboniger]QEV17321.1 ATP-binding cassette domain-containing protein [Streptomyces alboniger]